MFRSIFSVIKIFTFAYRKTNKLYGSIMCKQFCANMKSHFYTTSTSVSQTKKEAFYPICLQFVFVFVLQLQHLYQPRLPCVPWLLKQKWSRSSINHKSVIVYFLLMGVSVSPQSQSQMLFPSLILLCLQGNLICFICCYIV